MFCIGELGVIWEQHKISMHEEDKYFKQSILS